jgi:hypothetical protein
MAHFAVGFFALALISLALAGPIWVLVFLIVPALLSAYVARTHTVADRDTVTATTLRSSETVAWDDVAGLRFGKGSSAFAVLKDGRDLRLPAVTFSTLPRLTEASGGRVPNPYAQ